MDVPIALMSADDKSILQIAVGSLRSKSQEASKKNNKKKKTITTTKNKPDPPTILFFCQKYFIDLKDAQRKTTEYKS